MRVCFPLTPANLVVLLCLVFTSGCQNEFAVTESVASPQVAHASPPAARALDGSDKGDSIEATFKKDALVRESMNHDSFDQVNWEQDLEQDIPQESAASQATEELMVDTTLSLGEDLKSYNTNTSRADSLLQRASER